MESLNAERTPSLGKQLSPGRQRGFVEAAVARIREPRGRGGRGQIIGL
jgi:hypothetical protein